MNLIGFIWLIYLAISGGVGEGWLPSPRWLIPPAGSASLRTPPTALALALLDTDCIWLQADGCTVWQTAPSRVTAKRFEALPALAATPEIAPAPASASPPVVVNPLRKLYSRLVPWLRGDRPRSAVNPVTLVHAEAVPTTVMADTQLFHLCETRYGLNQAIAYQAQAPYQVWVNGQQVLALPTRQPAERLVRSLRQLLQQPDFDPAGLRPLTVEEQPGVWVNDQLLLGIDPALARTFRRNADLLAMEWTNNLRRALGSASLSLPTAQADLYGVQPSASTLSGIASWYGPYFHKRLTANGERFNQDEFTAAHKTLEFGTQLRVTNLANGLSVIVRINDRGPYFGDRSLDLSYQAALCIGGEESGLVNYEAVILQPDSKAAPISLPWEQLKAEHSVDAAIANAPTR